MKLVDIHDKKAFVWNETFAVIKAKNIPSEAFAVIRDKDEITVIIDQSRIHLVDAVKIEKDWKLITFDMILPFNMIGFLAEIARELAEANISIFVISSFSTDHILVKEKDLAKTLEKLVELGFKI